MTCHVAGCTGKIRFNHQKGAQKQVAKMERKGRGYVRAYECPACHGWHLTSMQVWQLQESTIWRYLWYRIKRWGRP